jgi:cytochrome b pre-mRNA-processing protein 3
MLALRSLRINLLTNISINSVNISKQFSRTATLPGFYGPPKGDEGLIRRIARKLGWGDVSKGALRLSGYKLYMKIADEIEYKNFFEVCDMEDTFASWFSIVELHVWMFSARLMEDKEEGKIVRNSMIQAMWEDNDLKSKKLEGALASARRQQIQQLNHGFHAALISYDEGLLGNDKVLAGALWRRFLSAKEPANQEELLKQIVALEMLVLYVRYQFKLLNSLSREKFIRYQDFQFVPFTKQLFELAEKNRNIVA